MRSLARKYFSKNLKQKTHHFLNVIDHKIFPFFTKSAFLSSVYYLLFSSEFRREHKAVLNGRLAYQFEQNKQKELAKQSLSKSSYLLRRNIHRLEKGLVMRPRRSVFAEDYIKETVHCYSLCVVMPNINSQELAWASEVLSEYFSIVDNTCIIYESRMIFESSHLKPLPAICDTKEIEQVDFKPTKNLPYARLSTPELQINSQQFEKLCIKRRSIRWYVPKKVPDELLNQAIKTASLAPSACNRQPFEFFVINDLKTAPKVAELAGGTAGFSSNIPCIIVLVGDLSAYPMERDRHIVYIDSSLAAMQLMLSLETLGLSSCLLNWPDLDVPENKMSKLLNLPVYKRPIMLLSVGYALEDGLIPCSVKKPISILRTDIQL